MSLSKIRQQLNTTSKMLGHVQAGQKAQRQQSMEPIVEHVTRSLVATIVSTLLATLFRRRR